jgi:hypothetical protein
MHVGMHDWQPDVTYTQKSKQTNMHTCVSVYLLCLRSKSESASHSSPPQLNGALVISACVCARACAGTISLISALCVCLAAGARRDTTKQTHTKATIETQANTRQKIMENQHFHSSTVSQYSATRNTTHSPKPWKPGKNVRWQVRQLVVVQRKLPVSRRNREVGNQL